MQGTNGEGLNARLVQLVYTATGTAGVRSAQVFIAGGTVLGVFPGIDASIPLTRESLATPSAPVPAPVGPSRCCTAGPGAGWSCCSTASSRW